MSRPSSAGSSNMREWAADGLVVSTGLDVVSAWGPATPGYRSSQGPVASGSVPSVLGSDSTRGQTSASGFTTEPRPRVLWRPNATSPSRSACWQRTSKDRSSAVSATSAFTHDRSSSWRSQARTGFRFAALSNQRGSHRSVAAASIKGSRADARGSARPGLEARVAASALATIVSWGAANSRTSPCAFPAHSGTVSACSRMPVRPRMQGWPVSSPIGHALLLHALSGGPGLVAALAMKRSRAARPPAARRLLPSAPAGATRRRPLAEILLMPGAGSCTFPAQGMAPS